jgi:2-methylcitrate dehydratase PrpD
MTTDPHIDLSRELCGLVERTTFKSLPEDVIGTLKLFLIDTFGVIRAATHAPGLDALWSRFAGWERDGSATALLSGQKLSPPSAALVNGSSAHALDYDDQHDPARVHTNCVIVPGLLAAAEDVGSVSGERFLTGLAIGAELHARLGLACYRSLGWGWHPTAVLGAMAGALAVGSLLGLDEEHLVNAFGLAFHQASGSAQSMRDGVLSKRLGAGFAARNAVTSGFLAADGLTGTRRTLEGGAGLVALYERGEFDSRLLFDDWGSRWEILEYSLKPYPCCRATHTVIGLGLQLREKGLSPESVQSVEIGLAEFNWTAVGAPYEPSRRDVVHAQFSASYTFARALVDGRVDFDSFRPDALDDPEIARITARCRSVNDRELEPSAIHPARVVVTLLDGTVVRLDSDKMKGSPDDPMEFDDVIAKYRACVSEGLGRNDISGDELIAHINSLESSDDAARDLIRAFPR